MTLNYQNLMKNFDQIYFQNTNNDFEAVITSFLQDFKNHKDFTHLDPDSFCSEFKSLFIKYKLNAKRYELTTYIISLSEKIVDRIKKENITNNSSEKILNSKELKILKDVVQYLFYFVVVDCLESEPALSYLEISKNYKLHNQFMKFENGTKSDILQAIMKFLIFTIKIPIYGDELWKCYPVEYLCPFLQLCFSPTSSLDTKEIFRPELELVLNSSEPSFFLHQLICIQRYSTRARWLNEICRTLILRRFLMQENGLNHVIRLANRNGNFSDWTWKEATAKLVTLVKTKDMTSYYESMGGQVVTLANETYMNKDGRNNTEMNINILNFIAFIIEQFASENINLTEEFIYKKLLAPIRNTTDIPEICTEYSIEHCVSLFHKIYVEAMSPSLHLQTMVKPILCPLISLACLNGISHVKSLCVQILSRYLRQLPDEECVSALMVITGLQAEKSSPRIKPGLCFEFADDNLQLVPIKSEKLLEDDALLVKTIVQIIVGLLSPTITRLYFESVSKHLTLADYTELKGNILYTEVDKIDREFDHFRALSKVSGLLSCMVDEEKLINDIFSNLESSQKFLRIVLESSMKPCSNESVKHIQDSISLNIVLLLFLYLQQKVKENRATRSDWEVVKELIPILKTLKSSSRETGLQTLVDDLVKLILSHGSTSTEKNTSKSSNSKLKQTLDDLHSPDIPIKGHGIIALTRLLREGDTEALEKLDAILLLFKYHLKNEDSYVYLASIEGLATICDICPDEAVPLLTKEFTDNRKLPTETRLKIVECLTKATNQLGDLLPKYRNYFINSLLFGCRDEDELIRSSALSNLGELCQNLRFSLGPIATDVLMTVRDAIMCDKSTCVRRAAVMVLTLILRGLDKSMFKILNDILLPTYRFLKTLRGDPDETLCLHVELAIDEIDLIAKSFLTPKLTMTKKIYVTELPPSL